MARGSKKERAERKPAVKQARSGFGPGAVGPAEIDELAEVIGVVVGKEESFSEHGLAFAMRKSREKIGARIPHKLDHGSKVALERLDAGVPCVFAGRVGRLGPVAAGKIRRDVIGIAAELEDVPLCDAGVLEKLPAGVAKAGSKRPALDFGKAFESVHEMNVSAAALEQISEMFAERRDFGRGTPRLGFGFRFEAGL